MTYREFGEIVSKFKGEGVPYFKDVRVEYAVPFFDLIDNRLPDHFGCTVIAYAWSGRMYHLKVFTHNGELFISNRVGDRTPFSTAGLWRTIFGQANSLLHREKYIKPSNTINV